MTSSSAFRSLSKILLVLFIFPTLFSICSVIIQNITSKAKCYIGPVNEGSYSRTTKEFFGIHFQTIQTLGPNNGIRREFKNCNHSFGVSSEWTCDEGYSAIYVDLLQGWCYTSLKNQEGSYCASSVNDPNVINPSSFPFSGIYISMRDPDERLSIKCVDTSSGHSTGSRNQIYPSTSLLLLLNVGLAFIYWDKRVDPSTVSKHYNKIVMEKEIWRSFTGALAHFEPLHLGFNMMSLQALGTALEPRYGSIPFLQYNICMIPLTTVIMLLLIKLRIRYTGNHQHAETSSVGFSGVLFAWMVVASLEYGQVCPIPFAPQMCFHTHDFDIMKGITLKFNWGPFVQLLFAQFIMPRVSFIGHLSGIICGFLFSWSILPKSIFWSSQVLIPLIILLHWRFVRKIKFLLFQSSDDDDNEDDEIQASTKTNEMKSRQGRLWRTLFMMVAISVLSTAKFGFITSVTLSQLLCCVMIVIAIHQQKNRNQVGSSTFNEALILRGTIIALIIALVSDSFVVPIWISTQIRIFSIGLISTDLGVDICIMMMRWITILIGLTQASAIMIELDLHEDEPKIFSLVFGKIVKWSSEVHQKHLIQSPSYTPFGGTGIALGSSNESNISSSTNRRSIMSVDL